MAAPIVSRNSPRAIVRPQVTTTKVDVIGGTQGPPGSTTIPATQIGQVFYSLDGLTLTPQLPITGDGGWLTSEDGILIVNG